MPRKRKITYTDSSKPVHVPMGDELAQIVANVEENRKREEAKAFEKRRAEQRAKWDEEQARIAAYIAEHPELTPEPKPEPKPLPMWLKVLITIGVIGYYALILLSGFWIILLLFSFASRRPLFWGGWIVFKDYMRGR